LITDGVLLPAHALVCAALVAPDIEDGNFTLAELVLSEVVKFLAEEASVQPSPLLIRIPPDGQSPTIPRSPVIHEFLVRPPIYIEFYSS
jgi:hypothetical protein